MAIIVGTRERGARNRRALDLGTGAPYYKSEWMEGGSGPGLSPTIFLVEQPSGSILPTHFHRQNEFQVVVSGTGRIGLHGLAPVSVHYAGAYTGYGPVAASEGGLSYFTIRPAFDSGALLASQAREHMIRGPKRQQYAPTVEIEALRKSAANAHATQILMPEAEDGLHCEAWMLPPSSLRPVPVRADTAGVFCLVLEGRISAGEHVLETWESAYIPVEEDGYPLRADAEGAIVLYMQCPATAAEYRSPPQP